MPAGLRIERVRLTEEVRHWISARHYSQSCPVSAKYTFALLSADGRQIGYCLFGLFTRLQARKKYPGHLELVRLCVDDEAPKNTESFFIGACLRAIKKDDPSLLGVISYCDVGHGHTGTVYRASNFVAIGFTSRSYHYEKGARVHKKGVWERAKKAGRTETEQAILEGLVRVQEERKLIFQYLFGGKHLISPGVRRFHFFQKWTRESAWLYGAWLGDGHVSSTLAFVGNRSTIDCAKRLLEIETETRKRGVYEIRFGCQALSQWFSARGIGSKKKLRCRYPDDIPEELKWHFIRGLIDTDGGFGGVKKGTLFALSFSSANREFIEQFVRHLGVEANIREERKQKDGKVYTQWAVKWGFYDSVRILDRVYEDSEGIRNEERYQKYLTVRGVRDQRLAQVCTECGRQAVRGDLCFRHDVIRRSKERERCSFEGCGKGIHDKKKGLCMEHAWESLNKDREWYRNFDVNRRIKERRIELGLNQTQLGRLLGHKSNGHVSNVETNRSYLGLKQIERFAVALQTTVEALLGESIDRLGMEEVD